MTQIVLLTPPKLDQMLSDPKFSAFPCFKDPPTLPQQPAMPKACGGCSGYKLDLSTMSLVPPYDYNQLKVRIAHLPPETKQQLRDLLGCDMVVMQFKTEDGALKKDEF